MLTRTILALALALAALSGADTAQAQFLPGTSNENRLGPIFSPQLYGMRPPRADNAWVRENTAPSPPPQGYDSWAHYHARQMGISACTNEPGYYQNSREYCERRGW